MAAVDRTPQQEACSRWYKVNKYRHLRAVRRWQAENPLRYRWNCWRRNTRKRGIPIHLTREEYYWAATSMCHYCGRLKGMRTTLLNGPDRKDSDGVYSRDNVVPCCFQCNARKGRKSYEAFCLVSGMFENGGGI